MDTKWKKGKSLFSFMAFATGLTMLVSNLIPAAGMVTAFGTGILEGQPDYQESEEFRNLICERLSMLMGVAVWEKNDSGNGADGTDAKDQSGQERDNRPLQEAVAVQEETVVEESADYADYYYGYDFGDQESLDRYMADLAKDKNLRYAVICQNQLLYSNMEGFGEKAGQEWNGEDFSQDLDADVYNFTLWYNRENDGKVAIVKDRWEENVYGDGVYRDSSRWRVPGYSNFTIGDSYEDVVIFLAAAKNPQLYMVRENGNSNIAEYGGRLYRMRLKMVYLHSAAERTAIFWKIGRASCRERV